jgi:hypothetical protein
MLVGAEQLQAKHGPLTFLLSPEGSGVGERSERPFDSAQGERAEG